MSTVNDQEIVRKLPHRKLPQITSFTAHQFKTTQNRSPTTNNLKRTKQGILVLPRYESTPLRRKRKREDNALGNQLLIDISPVNSISNRTNLNHRCKLKETDKHVTFEGSKSNHNSITNNATSQDTNTNLAVTYASKSPAQNKMLSLDESILKSFDMENIEKSYRDKCNATKCSGEAAPRSSSPDLFSLDESPKEKRNSLITADVGNVTCNKNTKKTLTVSCSRSLFEDPGSSERKMVTDETHQKNTVVSGNDMQLKDFLESGINWANDSMVANAVKDEMKQNINSLKNGIPMGEKIKMKLLTNAHKPVTNVYKDNEQCHPCEDSETAIPDKDIGPFFGLPSKVKLLLQKYKGINDLYEWQEECLNLKAIRERKNLIYALPTSGGKTLVAEILILKELLCYKKNVIFVLPFVSIVQEKIHSLSSFAVELGFLLEEYAAGKGIYPPRKRRRKQSVYISTIEKALSLVNSLIETKRLSEIGLVVVDELHLLGEQGGRGATLENFLTRVQFCSGDIHIIGMSATIGNLNEIAQFLHAETYARDFRPVDLKEYVKCEDNVWIINKQAKCEEDSLELVRKLSYPYTPTMAKKDPDRLGGLVTEVVPSNSCLIFCSSKKSCENVALLICSVMPRHLLQHEKEKKMALYQALKSEGNGSVCSILRKCLAFGVAYHHSGLTSEERRLLEEAYSIGTLCCICCTSTLAAGVNLPAKRVIVRSPYVARDFINLSQYKQMVGRAGRAGMNDCGEGILICKSSEMQKVRQLLHSKMNDVTSSLHVPHTRGMQTVVLSAVGLGLANSRSQLHKMASFTLLNVQATQLEVSVTKVIDEAVAALFKLKALKVVKDAKETIVEESSDVNNQSNISINMSSTTVNSQGSLTPNVCSKSLPLSKTERKGDSIQLRRETKFTISRLGKAAMKAPIDLKQAHVLYKDLVQAQASLVLLSCLHLLYLITPYELMAQIRPVPDVYFTTYTELNMKDLQTAHVLGLSEGIMLRIIKGSTIKSVSQHVVHRFYLTLMLHELWNEKSVWEVAQKYQVPRGTVQSLLSSASSFASCVMRFCEELTEFWAFKDLLTTFIQRLSYCCTSELLPLLELPAVKRGRAKQLYNAGYKTLTDIANAKAQSLVQSVDHMPKKVATQIIAAAKLLLLEKAETLQEEAEDVLEGLNAIQGT